MQIWAHRGRVAPHCQGNTFPDFKNSVRIGVNGIETDVCFSSPDKNCRQKLVIHHPRPNDRNHGKPEAKSILLDDFLGFLKTRPEIHCLLEPKENSEELVRQMVEKIISYKLEERVYLTVCQTRVAFLDLEISAKLALKHKALNPGIKTHIIATFPFSLPKLARKYNPDIISIGWLPDSKVSTWSFKLLFSKVLNLKNQIRKVQAMRIRVIGGIVNDREGFEYFDNLGVDGIMTDNATEAVEFAKEKSQ